MTTEPSPEAIEAAAAGYYGDRIAGSWERLSEGAKMAWRYGAHRALSAALPVLRAQIIRELAEEAGAKFIELRSNPRLPIRDIQATDDAFHAARWLRARANHEETPA